jgi:hypothetical protein
MAQSPGPQDAFPPSDMGNMAPPSPMQAMASGGIVGYKNKGKTEYKEAADDYGKQLQEIFEKEGRYKKRYSDYEKGERFTYPLTPRDYVVSDEEYSRLKEGDYVMGEGALQEYRPFLMLLNALDGESGARYMPESEVKGLKAKLKASIMEDKLSQMGMASGGRTGYQVGGFTPTAENPYPTGSELVSDTFTPTEDISNEDKAAVDANFGQLAQLGTQGLQAIRVLNEDGSINYAQAAIAIASINPAFRLGKAAVGLGGRAVQKFAPKLLEKGKNLITKPGVKIQNPALKTGVQYGDDVIDPKTGAKIKQVITGPRTLKIPSAKGLLRGAGNLALPSLVVGNLIESGMERKAIEKEEARLLAEQKAAKQEELLAEEEAKIAAEKAKQEAAIQAQIKKEKEQKQADMLVGLGGAIMSAKNIGELGTGISDVYTGIQTREDAKSLTGLQGRLLQAQASQIEANIAGMDLKELQASAKIIGDGLENGALTVEEYGPTFQAIADKITLLQGLQPKLGGETILAANERVSGGN